MATSARVIMQLKQLEGVGEVMPLVAAQYVAKRARDLAPVDTGYMRSQIHAKKTGDLDAVVEARAPYSGYVEFGTYKMAAQPYLRPAMDQGMHEVAELTAKEVNAEIRRRLR